MTKEWYSPVELASLNLPGFSSDKRQINRIAVKSRWRERQNSKGEPLCRPRNARGGGYEYHVSLLPHDAFESLWFPWTEGSVPTRYDQASLWAWYDGQTCRIKDAALARMKVILAITRLCEQGMPKTLAIDVVVKEYRHSMRISPATVWNWLRLVAGLSVHDYLPALAPRQEGKRSYAPVDAQAWNSILHDYLRPERPAWTECYQRLIEQHCSPRGIQMPCSRTLFRKLEREVPRPVIIARRDGIEAAIQFGGAWHREAMHRYLVEQAASVGLTL